jgi:Fe-S-cluster containining protein
MDAQQTQNVFRPLTGGTFSFACHNGVACFTECCAKLRLNLTPYDILRMKDRLGVSSDRFLETYTDTVLEDQQRFPMVRLRMGADEKGTCPFVTKKGCTIYEDRPSACRLYPVGRASTLIGGEKGAREKFFLVSESHCLGFQERKQWTVEEWMAHEGLRNYNTMNDGWLQVVTSSKSLGEKKDASQKIQMFFMASYNLDRFRGFLFQSKFFELFDVEAKTKETLARDDLALMNFAFEWLKFSLFGEKTMLLKRNTKRE